MGSVVLGSGVETAEDQCQAGKEVPVVATIKYEAWVVEKEN